MLDFAFLTALARASTTSGTVGPTAPPVSVTRSLYSGSKIQITWVPGDSTATTRLYDNTGAFLGSFPAGTTSWSSGLTSLNPVRASHKKNNVETSLTSES